MIIDDIINELLKKRHEYYINSEYPPTKEPEFAIYIGVDLYYTMMGEIKYDSPCYDYIELIGAVLCKILGYKVYKVISDHEYWRIVSL